MSLTASAQGEVSDEEAAIVDAGGKQQQRVCMSPGHPMGTFPLNTTSTEAFSPELFRAYCRFKRRAANSYTVQRGTQASIHETVFCLLLSSAGCRVCTMDTYESHKCQTCFRSQSQLGAEAFAAD